MAILITCLSTEWIYWLEAISFVLGNNTESVTHKKINLNNEAKHVRQMNKIKNWIAFKLSSL